jgi:hypothetical protein
MLAPGKKVSSIGCGSTASPTMGAGPVFSGAVSDQKASAGSPAIPQRWPAVRRSVPPAGALSPALFPRQIGNV